MTHTFLNIENENRREKVRKTKMRELSKNRVLVES